MNLIEGEAGDWRWAVRPDLGASITRLEWRGRPILRPAPPYTRAVLETGCFPLVPYANRVGHGRFEFADQAVSLPVLPAFAPHALHGDGWRSVWTLVDGSGPATLMYRNTSASWPWLYEARQLLAFDDNEASVTVSVRNLSDRPMPWGIGLHPYFPVGPKTRLAFQAEGVWETGPDQLPSRLSPPGAVFDWSGGAPVADAPFVDHCYSGCGPARLTQDDHEVVVRASDTAPLAQVYAPGGGFVCFEPVTHRPDAFNAPESESPGGSPIGPGELRSVQMTLTVEAR